MNQHTVTVILPVPREQAFLYLSNVEKLPEWATEFARELKVVDGRHKVVNGLGEFFFEIHADEETGVIEKFRPYALPDAGWLEHAASRAAAEDSPRSR